VTTNNSYKMCLPSRGPFTLTRNKRKITVPADMNVWARYSDDEFWTWFVNIKNRDNSFELQLSYSDIVDYESYKAFHPKAS